MPPKLTPLPIDEHVPRLVGAARERGALVVVAEPGAGKTTRLPAGLIEAVDGQVMCLQPRRVAARAAAERVAGERGWRLGGEVGYAVRDDRRASADTRLLFVTEGILTRRLIDDPLLEGVGCVVLDEFHERSIHADLALAMLREVRAAREDLVVVVMSATLDAAPVAAFLDAPVEEVAGRVFPVEITHRPPTGDRSPVGLAAQVSAVLAGEPDDGDALVFLPGAAEIDACVRELARRHADVRPLHGGLEFAEQRATLEPADGRRIICATNIAETSLTIDGVTLVVDSGLARVAVYDERRGMDRLERVAVSRARAEQRAGRAGRTRPGRCVRLWSAREHGARPAHEAAEVARADLCEAVMAAASWGKLSAFGWYETPPPARLAAAVSLLNMLGLMDGEALTDLGRRLRRVPAHPRVARLLAADASDDAAWLAAVLSDGGRGPVELHARLAAARREGALRRASRRYSQLPTGDRNARPADGSPIPRWGLATAALTAFPDRLCKLRDDATRGVMTDGSGVRLREGLGGSPTFIVALEVMHDERAANREATVTLAAGVTREEIEAALPHLIRDESAAEYDAAADRVAGVRRRRVGAVVLEEKRGVKVDDDAAADALRPHLDASLIDADEEVAALYARAAFVRRLDPAWASPLPEAAELLTRAAAGTRSLADVRRRAAKLAKEAAAADWTRTLEQAAPTHLTLPSGNRARLDWSRVDLDEGMRPVLAAKLQELFGLAETPAVGPPGRGVPVTLHLLAPNRRPVQVTDDLASFWANTYPQVRKDLRARYAKHPWPDDPLAATATARTKRHGGTA